MKHSTKIIIKELIENYPDLKELENHIVDSVKEIRNRINNGGKILVCGNGGSASDSEHIVGELLKEFYIERPLDSKFKEDLLELFPLEGPEMAIDLQGGIPAISLVSQTGFLSAYGNDSNPHMAFGQQVYVYGSREDVFIGLSTSGNSLNVVNAAKIAKVKGLFVLSLTGQTGGRLKEVSDVNLRVPFMETYRIQEHHLPIYHCICRALENEIFGDKI